MLILHSLAKVKHVFWPFWAFGAHHQLLFAAITRMFENYTLLQKILSAGLLIWAQPSKNLKKRPIFGQAVQNGYSSHRRMKAISVIRKKNSICGKRYIEICKNRNTLVFIKPWSAVRSGLIKLDLVRMSCHVIIVIWTLELYFFRLAFNIPGTGCLKKSRA